MDVSAACSGFLFALETAKALMEAGPYKLALVIGAEKLSGITNWKDRNTCVLFGDGAGARFCRNARPGGNIVHVSAIRRDSYGHPDVLAADPGLLE